MRRATGIAALLLAAGLLTGCTKISTEEFAKRFEGQDGVVSVDSSCGALNCSGTVTMAETATAEEIEDIASELEGMLGDEINEGTVRVRADQRDLSLVVRDSGHDLGPLAEALALAGTTEHVVSLSLSAVGRLSPSIGLAPEARLADAARIRASFVELLDPPELSVSGPDFRINGGSEADPAAELELALAVDRRFSLATATVFRDQLLMRVSEYVDLAEARSFLRRQPGFAGVALVDLSNRKDLVLGVVDARFGRTALEMVEVLRGEPGFVSLSASRDDLDVTTRSLSDAQTMDRLLDERFGERYAGSAVSFTDRAGVRVGRQPAGRLRLDLAQQLVGQGLWSTVRIDEDNLGNESVTLVTNKDVAARAATAALARTDLAELPLQVELSWQGGAGRARFGSGGPEIEPEARSGELPAADRDALVQGWAEGLADPRGTLQGAAR